MTHSLNIKFGSNRGNRRVWLDQKSVLESSGWLAKETRYDLSYVVQGNMPAVELVKNTEGKKRVSGKAGPVIDICNKAIGPHLGDHVARVDVTVTDSTIVIKEAV